MNRLVVVVFVLFAGCDLFEEGDSYTLYRNSPAGPMRIHMATFDTNEGKGYNLENCQITARLFKAQPGVTVEYWCEKGKYRR